MPDDSALSRLDTDSARYGDPRRNPIAFLPVDGYVPARVDDWCEDRRPDELSDDDGRE